MPSAVRTASGTGPAAAGTRSVREARAAVLAVFLAHALLFASWTAHIPEVKARLGLTNATLGVALLGAPLGAMGAMLVTGWLLARWGSRRMVQLTLAGYCLTALGVGAAGSPWQLFTALAGWGVFQGALDVSMNTQAITVERAAGRPLMSGFHAAWSGGGFVGAGLGTLGVAVRLPLAGQLLVLGSVAALGAGWASRRMLPDPPVRPGEHPRQARSGSVLFHPAVLILGAVALACMLCEGAAADWSAVYLHDSLRTSPAFAGLGYAAFSAAMVAVRLTGDRLLTRFPVRQLLPALALAATAALAAALLFGTALLALLAFTALGVGVALIIPAAFSAAGRLPGINPGSGVAAVSALGWVGFVGGPPLIGHLAGLLSLPAALFLLPLLTTAIALATRTTRAFGSGRRPGPVERT